MTSDNETGPWAPFVKALHVLAAARSCMQHAAMAAERPRHDADGHHDEPSLSALAGTGDGMDQGKRMRCLRAQAPRSWL